MVLVNDLKMLSLSVVKFKRQEIDTSAVKLVSYILKNILIILKLSGKLEVRSNFF